MEGREAAETGGGQGAVQPDAGQARHPAARQTALGAAPKAGCLLLYCLLARLPQPHRWLYLSSSRMASTMSLM